MSYILEALKKSQQERELGQVPTLKTPILLAEAETARPNPWTLVAVGLAALAVAIALFGAWRSGSQTKAPAAESRDAAEMRAEDGPKPPLPPIAAPPDQNASARPPAARPAGAEIAPPAEPPAADIATAADAAPRAPLPPLESLLPEIPPEFDEEAYFAPEEPAARPAQSKIPPDLIADIEAFKRQVSAAQAETAEDAATIAPQDLRLPKDVAKRLPAFVMSAHIYDEGPSKRFVLINGLKTREGEESREGITVESILPDGVVLRFEGHRFFQRR